MQNSKSSGIRIRELINKKGLKDKDFAELIQTNPQTLSRILNDKYAVSPKMATKMAKVLSTSPEYLLCQTDNVGDSSFVLSAEWFERNSQHYYISKVIDFLKSLEYSITELVIINNLEFKRNNTTLKFNTFAAKKDLLEFGITFAGTNNTDMFIEHECSEDILIEIIKSPHTHASAHCWEIEFQDTIKRIDEQQFLDIMYSFALLTQNYFSAVIYDSNKSNVKLTDIGIAINKKKQEEIAQGTWQPPTEEEQQQKLLRAVYGENIPDTPKKEE